MDGEKPGPQRRPTLAVQLLSHHVVRPMYDATGQENTSLTRMVSALSVVIGRGGGSDMKMVKG
jgi:hypothetical protein